MKALLLRVGIDKGTDGCLGPIFEDGSFEFIPISEYDEESKETRRYNNTIGRHGRYLSYYLPKPIANRVIHFDPEFETFTYGDPTPKRSYLLKLNKEDLLVFYAGLVPFETVKFRNALYIIGYLVVVEVIDFNTLSADEMTECREKYANNAHLKRNESVENLVLVAGNKRSKLLSRAILISQENLDSRGRPYFAVSEERESMLGIKGSIQRSIPPRWIRGDKSINNLKNILGLGARAF